MCSSSFIFWTDLGTPSKLERGDLDGYHFSSRKKITTNEKGTFKCFALDYVNQLLFWVNNYLNSIHQSNYDSGDSKVVIDNFFYSPTSFYVHQNQLFWIHNRNLYTYKHYNGNSKTIFRYLHPGVVHIRHLIYSKKGS